MATVNHPIDSKSTLKDFDFLVREYNRNARSCSFRVYRGAVLQPVEDQYLGEWPRNALRRSIRTPHRFFLLIRGFLNLHVMGNERESIRYIYDNCVRVYPNPTKKDGDCYHEYGSHLYVSLSGSLVYVCIYKRRRTEEHFSLSVQLLIHDILPKRREYLHSDTNTWLTIIVNAVVVYQTKFECNAIQYTRLWHRFGREELSRFVESSADVVCYKQHIDLMTQTEYYGVYVEDWARLIIDEQTTGGHHNHTLIMGGVFLIFESEFLIAFRDNEEKEYSVSQLIRMKVLSSDTPVSNQIVILSPVPSKGDTICWHIHMEDRNQNRFATVLRIPLHGWRISERICIVQWNDANLADIVGQQKKLDYSRYIRDSGVDPPLLPPLKTAEFENGEQYFYPTYIESDEIITEDQDYQDWPTD